MRSPAAGFALLLAAACSRESEPAPAPPPAAVDPFRERCLEAGRRLSAAEGPAEQQRWVGVLASYGGDPNPQVALPALDALLRYVKAGLAERRAAAMEVALDTLLRSDRPERRDLLRDLLASRPETWMPPDRLPKLADILGGDAAPLLRSVLASRLDPWVRCDALRRLADTPGVDAMPLLLDSLADADLRGTAAIKIGEGAGGRGDPDIVRRLAAAGAVEMDPAPLGAIVLALRNVGGDEVRPLLATWVDRLAGWSRTDVAWFVHRRDPWHLVDRLVAEKFLPFAPRPEDLNHALSGRTDSPAPVSERLVTAAFLYTGILVRESLRRLDGPADYPGRVRHFGLMSRGLFKPTGIAHEKDVVSFDAGGRPYRFTVRDLGDWIDAAPLVDAVNRSLEDLDVPERFIGLHHAGDAVVFVLAIPDQFRKLAQELQIPLEPDADAPRKRFLNPGPGK